MKIAVNTRLLLAGKLEGIGWFTYQTFSHLVRNHPEVDFTFIFDRHYSEEFIFGDNVKPVVLFPQARHPILYYLFFEKSVPRFLDRHPHDLFLSPDGLLSLSYPGRQLPVFHDLNFIHQPDNLPRLSSWYYNRMFPRYAAHAQRIATVSEFSRQDIIKTLGIAPRKVDVVYNGVNPVFAPISQQKAMQLREEYTGSAPYFIYVGSLHKRKNIENMLLAFDRFKSADQQNYKLIIVGQSMFGTARLRKILQALNHQKDVIFIGRLFEEQLRDVMGAARALLLVSFFEGFGIPIVEAMKCGVPVITSYATSMPEVAGDAALLVEPSSVEAICEAMRKIAGDQVLHQQLRQKGFENAQRFSWEKTADSMWNCIQKALE